MRARIGPLSEAKRDPEMHQAKKGNQWQLGTKMHSGVDVDAGLMQSEVRRAAEVADVEHAHELLHGRESQVHGDGGYTGATSANTSRHRRLP